MRREKKKDGVNTRKSMEMDVRMKEFLAMPHNTSPIVLELK